MCICVLPRVCSVLFLQLRMLLSLSLEFCLLLPLISAIECISSPNASLQSRPIFPWSIIHHGLYISEWSLNSLFLTTVFNVNFGIWDYLIHYHVVKMQMSFLLDFKFNEVRDHVALLSLSSPGTQAAMTKSHWTNEWMWSETCMCGDEV